MAILVNGGAGYIGSHTCIELMKAGYEIIVADNLYNSCEEALRRVEQISGKKVPFVNVDLCDGEAVDALFASHPEIDAVIHFAAYKAVGESVQKPLEYYTTKVMMEQILKDYCKADPTMNVALLRYFNPIGAHESGLIGEDPNGIPNNLVPYIAKVAVGTLEKVHVFGNDYPTPDGTGVRDYIHVVDLARGHVAALKKLASNCGLFICNLGTGKGYSVLDVIKAYSKACGKDLPYVIDPRRPGDIAECYADPAKARDELGWTAEYGIEEMCASSWKWQSMNPNGYKG